VGNRGRFQKLRENIRRRGNRPEVYGRVREKVARARKGESGLESYVNFAVFIESR